MNRILFALLFFILGVAFRILTFGLGQACSIGDSKTATTTFQISDLNQRQQAGQLSIAIVAKDNTTATDGDNGEITQVQGTNAGIYTKAAEFTNAQNGPGAGATISVWYCLHDVTRTAAPIATFSGSTTAKCYYIRGFTIGAGNTIGIQALNTLANDNGDPGSMTLGGLPSREYLFIRATALETNLYGNNSTTFSSGYSSFSGGSFETTTGNAGNSNMALVAEYSIATTTSTTSDPTVANADCASVLIAFYEAPVGTPPTRRVTVIQ